MRKKEEMSNNQEFFDDEIESFLASYSVPSIEDKKIEDTVDVLREYMPKKINKRNLLNLMLNEITYINKTYWIIAGILVVISAFLPLIFEISPYYYLSLIGPIPMILGISELIKGREEKMWEMEKSCKYNYKQIILARIIIICSFSIIIDLLLCTLIAFNYRGMAYMYLMLSWIAPFALIASLAFLMVSRQAGSGSIIGGLSIWICFVAIGNEYFSIVIEQLSTASVIGAIAISMAIFFYTVRVFYKKFIDYEEVITWN